MNLKIKNAKYGIYKSTVCVWEAETGCLQFQTPILGYTAKFQASIEFIVICYLKTGRCKCVFVNMYNMCMHIRYK